MVFAVNKMDFVDYDKLVYDRIYYEFIFFVIKLNIFDFEVILILVFNGDNVVVWLENMFWYNGFLLMYYFENVYVVFDCDLVDVWLPV